MRALHELPGTRPFPSEANMILARFADAAAVFEQLKQRRVLVKNVSGLHPLLANCLRLTDRHARRGDPDDRRPESECVMTGPNVAAEVQRNTKETQIRVRVDLDGGGAANAGTGIGFFDHMLDQVARHGLIDLEVDARATCTSTATTPSRDVGITLGQAVAQAVGDKAGLRRYGHAYVPLDEALSRVVVDFSGRPGLHMDVPFKAGMIGGFDTQLAYEFFRGFANHALVTLHIDNLKGDNAHHQCETVFKAFARALRMALEVDPRQAGVIPSTKGGL